MTAYLCSVCAQSFESRAASPRHRCKGDHAGRFGVPVASRDTQTDTPTESIHATRDTQPATPAAIEGDAEFFTDEDDEPAAHYVEPTIGASEDYIEPKKVDKPTTRGTVVKLATYFEALEHGLGMNTLSPTELRRVKAELAGNAADIHIETAELVIGAGTSVMLSAGLLALIYGRDLFGGDMSAILSMLKPEPEPALPRDEWAEAA
jgi:hypothetical protein